MITSPLNRQAWIDNLETHRDRDSVINRITNGFEIIPSDSVLKIAETNNYKSATTSDVQDQVENQIRKEISKGNYIVTHMKLTIVSALGAIPKPDTESKSIAVHSVWECSTTKITCQKLWDFCRLCVGVCLEFYLTP